MKYKKRILRVIILLATVILLAVSTYIYRIYQSWQLSVLTSGLYFGNNVMSGQVLTDQITGDGYHYIHNIAYGDTYPNSYMDICYNKSSDETTPTYIFIHGGGYIGISHVLYDWTDYGNRIASFYTKIVDAGYNIVSIDYAYAPEYAYPTPILQIDEAMQYLSENADELSLNMDKLVIGGVSAGGQLSGQYVAACLDSDYAAKIGMGEDWGRYEFDALVLQCALINPCSFADTNSHSYNLIYNKMGEFYFGSKWNGKRQEANLFHHLSEDLPPTFISDGTEYTFNKQASKLYKKLCRLGCDAELHIYEGMPHAFDYRDYEESYENIDAIIDFINRHTL